MKFLACLLVIIGFLSCNKKDVAGETNSYSDKIVLEPVEAKGDAVTLRWSRISNPKFSYYVVVKATDSQPDGEPIAKISDRKQTSFTEIKVPFTPNTQYMVVAVLTNEEFIASNIVTYIQSGLSLTLNPVTVSGDSLFLTWNKIEHSSLVNYTILRKQSENDQGYPIGTVTGDTKFYDNSYPFTGYVGYQVVANFSGGYRNTSNTQSYSVPAPTIRLNELKIEGNTAKLSWTPSNKRAFTIYYIMRKTVAGEQEVQIGNTSDSTFTDNDLPYTTDVSYFVRAFSPASGGGHITSNTQTFSRPDIYTYSSPVFDAKFDKANRLVYFFERSGTVSAYDLDAKKITKNIISNATIGYCDIGIYNRSKELYIPRNDGWIFVYDAITFEKKDQINVGPEVHSVVADNGLLFASVAQQGGSSIKVVNRSSKNIISQTGEWNGVRLKKIANTSTDILAMSMFISPIDVDYYSFNTDGTLKYHKDDTYHGTYELDFAIYEMFPNGNKFITGSGGSIYSKDMVFEATLPRGNLSFLGYGFDENGQVIYAGSKTKTVEAYSLSGYTHLRSYKTNLYPRYIFKDGNHLLCLSSPSNNNYGLWYNNTSLVIEFVDL